MSFWGLSNLSLHLTKPFVTRQARAKQLCR
jgi:hypothetical protein